MNTQIQTEVGSRHLHEVGPIDCAERLARAELLIRSGLVATASEIYHEILAQQENAAARHGAARCAYMRGELHEALGHLQLIANSDVQGVQNDLGVVFFELGLVEQAREQLSKAAASTPRDVTIWRNLLDIAMAQDDRERCREYAERVLALDPSDAQVRSLLEML